MLIRKILVVLVMLGLIAAALPVNAYWSGCREFEIPQFIDGCSTNCAGCMVADLGLYTHGCLQSLTQGPDECIGEVITFGYTVRRFGCKSIDSGACSCDFGNQIGPEEQYILQYIGC